MTCGNAKKSQNIWRCQQKIVSLQPYHFNNNMMYKKVKYDSKEDAVAAFRRMVQRKKEWVAQTERELEELAQERKLAI